VGEFLAVDKLEFVSKITIGRNPPVDRGGVASPHLYLLAGISQSPFLRQPLVIFALLAEEIYRIIR
jgi:hypothetical protein